MKVAAAASLVLLVAVALALNWVTGTVAGTRWSLELLESLLPALELEVEGGSWSGGLRLRQLIYRAPVVTVSIADLELQLRPRALWRWQLALEHVSARRVELQLIEREEQPPRGLPTVPMPILLTAQRVSVPHFELITAGGARLVAAIDTGLRWLGTDIRAIDGSLQWGQVHIDTDLGIRLQGDYPVDTRVTVTVPDLSGPLTADLQGSLVALQAQGRLEGRMPLSFSIAARLLDDRLPVTATARSAAPVAWELAGEQLTIDAVALDVTGNLDELGGRLQAELRNPRYGATTLAVPLAWRPGLLSVAGARWQSDHGAADAACEVETGAGRWRCAGDLRQLTLAPWTQAVAGRLSSPFEIAGSWGAAGRSLRAALVALRGDLAGQALSGRAAVSSADLQRWQLDEARVAFGASRAAASGSIGQVIALDGSIELARLEQLSESARGALSAAFSLAGPAAQPTVTANIDGRGLAYQQYRVRRLRGSLQLPELGGQPSRLDLRLGGLRVGDERLGRLHVVAQGSAARYQLSASLDGVDNNRMVLACQGAHGARWRLDCDRFDGQWRLGDALRSWRLASPVRMEFADQFAGLRVEPFCIMAAPASLCLNTRFEAADGLLARPAQVALEKLPLRWWAASLPANVRLAGESHLGATLDLSSLSPLSARLVASVDGLRWSWSNEDGTFPASLRALKLLVDFGPDRAQLTASANSEVLGLARLDLTVADPAGVRRLQGKLALEDLRLEAFRWVADSIQQLRGLVGGEVAIGGTAAEPRLAGRLQLRQGALTDASVPLAFEDIAATVDFTERAADIAGSVKVNDGLARLSGRLTLPQADQPWELRAQVDTDVIGFTVLQDSVAAGSGQLSIVARSGLMRINGDLRIAEADIRLRTLPPNTIGTSADAEVVGVDQRHAGWRVETDISVALGNRLHFRGFGADLWLAGKVRFRNTERFPRHMTGEVRVQSGRYRAYGQELLIRSGSVLFTGPIENPELRFEAVRRSRDMQTLGGLRVSGSLQNPLGELFSEPPMAESEVAYFVLTGRLRPKTLAGAVSAEGTLLNLGLAQTNEAAARFAERFGIKDFQISAAGTDAGLETRLSGFVAPNLLLSYGTGFQENTNTLTIQYFVTPNVIIEAISGFTSALDVIYSFSVD